MMRNIVPKGNYMVYEDTGEKVVFYECDPEKNIECGKQMCRTSLPEDEATFGFCAKTVDPRFRKDGTKAWHAVLKPSPDGGVPYWGREYIEGV